MNVTNKAKLNNVKNRFLAISEAVAKGLEPEPKITDFEKIKELGTGSFGKVFLVSHKVTGVQYAIKAIDKRNKANIEEKPYFRREIEIMYKIHHPNVVRLYSNFEDDSNCYFIMEYINKGNLYNLIPKDKKKKLSQQLVAGIMKDVISAVYFLHNMNPPTIHRDIKPENVLLGENGIAKLTDFGWSNYIEEKEKRTTYCGTPIYLSPEIINETGHDEHVDIWCIGVLLFELITSTVPFPGNDIDTLQDNIKHLRIAWPRDINMDAKNLISKILKIDPKSRISLEEMLNHPFFTKNIQNPSQYLIKPDKLPNSIFIVSKENPNDPQSSHAQSSIPNIPKTIEITRNPRFRGGGDHNRDISPVPISKLHLDRIDLSPVGIKNILPHGKIDDNMKKIYDQIKRDYDKLQLKYNNTLALENKLEEEIKAAYEKIKSLEKEKNANNSNEDEQNLIMKIEFQEQKIKDLEESAEELQAENEELRDKISQYEANLSKKGTVFDDRLNAIRASLKEIPGEDQSEQVKKTANTFLIEVEKLKTELVSEKEKFTHVLQEKNLEIKKLKEEQNDIKDKEGKKYLKLINKYETTLTMTERDNKILKLKIKELETKISKMNLMK